MLATQKHLQQVLKLLISNPPAFKRHIASKKFLVDRHDDKIKERIFRNTLSLNIVVVTFFRKTKDKTYYHIRYKPINYFHISVCHLQWQTNATTSELKSNYPVCHPANNPMPFTGKVNCLEKNFQYE